MKHSTLYYAGYKHLSCDNKTHTHRLLNLSTKEIELWAPTTDGCGILYEDAILMFIGFEGRNYRYGTDHN